jgi:GT2 family glycosyltransferase
VHAVPTPITLTDGVSFKLDSQARTAGIGDKISVCLLTFNNVSLIEATVESIRDQTVQGYEIIISDDCSTDGTWELVQGLALKDPRIRAVRTIRNIGMPGNANFAVEQSARPYIALLHQDDLYRRDLLERWARILDNNEDVSFVFNPYDDIDEENAERNYGRRFDAERLDGIWFLEKFLLGRWGCPVRGTAMIRRSWWETVGGMREEFGLVADVDLWMRLARLSSVGYVPEPLIRVGKFRPDYYPDIYTQKTWHWRRRVLVYEIYAANWREYLHLNTLSGRLRWWGFRLKLSLETMRWLVYAIVKKRYDIIRSSSESRTAYDLLPLRVFRRILQSICPANKCGKSVNMTSQGER